MDCQVKPRNDAVVSSVDGNIIPQQIKGWAKRSLPTNGCES